jgi:pimeloyl-ACP methyl ester carboxylesterase
MKAKHRVGVETVFSEIKFTTGADGTQIAYHVFGSGPEVMFWQHGFNSDAEHWRYMLEYFPADEYRIIAPDLRGCGQSGKPADERAYTFDHLTQDALAVIRAEGLTTAGNFIIIYFSHETLGLGSSAGDQLYHCLAVVSSSLSLPANCLLGQS